MSEHGYANVHHAGILGWRYTCKCGDHFADYETDPGVPPSPWKRHLQENEATS